MSSLIDIKQKGKGRAQARPPSTVCPPSVRRPPDCPTDICIYVYIHILYIDMYIYIYIYVCMYVKWDCARRPNAS